MKRKDNNQNQLVQVIDEEFKRTIPIIHKEGKNNYALIQKTKSGIVRIMDRVQSEKTAREKVNEFIRNMPEYPHQSY